MAILLLVLLVAAGIMLSLLTGWFPRPVWMTDVRVIWGTAFFAIASLLLTMIIYWQDDNPTKESTQPSNATTTTTNPLYPDFQRCSQTGVVFASESNLVANPSFENNTSGWVGHQSVLSRTEHSLAPGGRYVATVTRVTGTEYTIDDWVGAAVPTRPGVNYGASAYVATASPSSTGKLASLVLRERESGSKMVWECRSNQVTLGADFQLLLVSGRSTTTGNHVGVYVEQTGAEEGDAFYADALRLSILG